MTIPLHVKDPEATLDFAFDWAASWLDAGETINSYIITAASGLTLASDSEDDGVVTAWVSGGSVGTTYRLECKIVTSAGRTDERSIKIRVDER